MPTISIITPVYNAAKFLDDTVRTVQAQTETDWEWVLVDDGSTDDSLARIQQYQRQDSRIKLILHSDKGNHGAAASRNLGISKATGRYITFLDADDLWSTDKLSKQLTLMRDKQAAFSYTGYEFADEGGMPTGGVVDVPESMDYGRLLKDTKIWTSTVMVDTSAMSKKHLYMPELRTGEDYSTWLHLLKQVELARGINEPLALYRRTTSSLSANKFAQIRSRWNVYRNVEGLGLARSFFLMIDYMKSAIKRRM